jgi:hypothetical protein
LNSKNIAYTLEYQKHREKFNYVFDDKYKSRENEERALPDKKHIIRISEFEDHSGVVCKYNINASHSEVFDNQGIKVAEFNSIDHRDFYIMVQHSNGKNYLLFSIDLYGYSLLDLTDYNIYHYIPEASFTQNQETFIWTNVLYSEDTNMIAVDGCYWAYPYSTEFFDFSEPNKLPYDLICSTYDMRNQVNIDSHVSPLKWYKDGNILLEHSSADGISEKLINVLLYKNEVK